MLEGYGESKGASQSKDLLAKSLCRQNENMPTIFGLASYAEFDTLTGCWNVWQQNQSWTGQKKIDGGEHIRDLLDAYEDD